MWPIVERRVPQSDVPGEVTSPTQPMPTLPEPFERQGVTPNDLNNLTPEILAEAKKIASRYRMGPLFNPPSVVTPTNRRHLAGAGLAGRRQLAGRRG